MTKKTRKIRARQNVKIASSRRGESSPLATQGRKPAVASREADKGDAGWSVMRLKEEKPAGQPGQLKYAFTFPVGDGNHVSHTVPNELSSRQIVKELKKYTTELPQEQRHAAAFIENLIASCPNDFTILVKYPGWRGLDESGGGNSNAGCRAFVTPGQVISSDPSKYVWNGNLSGQPHVGQVSGTDESWRKSVGLLSKQSEFVSFSIMAASAATLILFADLAENPIFNFVGHSSAGKTTAVKAGMSFLGNPAAICSWDGTARALEETAASYNNLLFVLNAAEKTASTRRRDMLGRITHMVSEGESTVRSTIVSEFLPNLTWASLVLSTSNKPGAAMAKELGLDWSEQDSVRFIDIAVPSAAEGGIFNRLRQRGLDIGTSERSIRALEAALKENFGAPLEPWIRYLLRIRPERAVKRYMDEFIERVHPTPGVEDRVARKFALVYAAGRMIVKAGIVPWPKHLPMQVCRNLYLNSRRLRRISGSDLKGSLRRLASALEDRHLLRRDVGPSDIVDVNDESSFLGVFRRESEGAIYGIRVDGLRALVGDKEAGHLRSWLKSRHLIENGHGKKVTQQLPITLRVNGRLIKKPRFVVVKADALNTSIAQYLGIR